LHFLQLDIKWNGTFHRIKGGVMNDQQQSGLADDLLRGAEAIAAELYNDTSEAAKRRVYNEQARWPIWNDNGILFALRSGLRNHVQAKSAQAAARVTTAQLEASQSKPIRRRQRRARRSAA
jgi:hypothetical protein